ncbi:peptidase C12, ubiquitin carboxyl-terminal hydrolase 1 [Ramaria rubella]|nr:peptidase C12, ubiquitin carboxyl-terminal hydrolase 1 [Ramaria rubella]
MPETPSRWIPLEANPEVLISWSSQAGLVTSTATFHDVYGLDPELLAIVPTPVKAVVFLFPITVDVEMKRHEEDATINSGEQPHVDPTVLFIKQTIPNACGTIGLLHALANSDVTITPGSPLAKFIEQAIPQTPEQRAELLEKTELFASIHASAANTGQSEVPTNPDTDLHFCAFVLAPSPVDKQLHLLELDGRRVGPVDRGPSTDLMTDVAKFIQKNHINNTNSMHFSMIALAPPEV